MPKSAFPSTKSRSHLLGARWTWRVDVLTHAGVECRLLTAFEPSTEQFLATLTYRRGEIYVMVARLECHGFEPGLHCHAACEPLAAASGGVIKSFGTKRTPAFGKFHGRVAYEMTPTRALEVAFGFFNVTAVLEGAMV